jgi:ribonuclease P protein component
MGRIRFPHAARVVKPADFLHLRKTGRRVGVRHFNAQATATDRDTARLGLAVSRRVSTDAVRRNRIKRVARDEQDVDRRELGADPAKAFARESADAHDNATLRADLEALWRRLAARPRD